MPILVRHDNYGMMGTLAAGAGTERLRQILEEEKLRRDQMAMQQQQNDRQYGLSRQQLADQRDRSERADEFQWAELDMRGKDQDFRERLAEEQTNRIRIQEQGDFERAKLTNDGQNTRKLADNAIEWAKLDLKRDELEHKEKINNLTDSEAARLRRLRELDVIMERGNQAIKQIDKRGEWDEKITGIQQQGAIERTKLQQQGAATRQTAALTRSSQIEDARNAIRSRREAYDAELLARRTAAEVAERELTELRKTANDISIDATPEDRADLQRRISGATQRYNEALRNLKLWADLQSQQRQAPATQPAMPSASPQQIAPPAAQPIGQQVQPIGQMAAPQQTPQAQAAFAAMQQLAAMGVDVMNQMGFSLGGRMYRFAGVDPAGGPMFQVIA